MTTYLSDRRNKRFSVVGDISEGAIYVNKWKDRRSGLWGEVAFESVLNEDKRTRHIPEKGV